MIPISTHGTVRITEATMISGVIHGAIHIIVQDGQLHLATTGEAPGIMDGVWAWAMVL